MYAQQVQQAARINMIPIAYRYGNSREDVYCIDCAKRRNNLAAATPITLDDIACAQNNNDSGTIDLECAFCGQLI